MKILYLCGNSEDYLSDSLLIGFRQLFGADCVDYPKCEILYKNCNTEILEQVRGKGFTLYSGILDDIFVDRFNVFEKIKKGFYDLIIFSSIQRQFGLFMQLEPWLKSSSTLLFDGEDIEVPFPSRLYLKRRFSFLSLPNPGRKTYLYFKREWSPKTRFNLLSTVLPKFILNKIPFNKNLRKISFAIPSQKILPISSEFKKTKLFQKHIVDEEIAAKINSATTGYAFDSEFDYYNDLQLSKFGVTTKRAGWDCLRHYEIAANGTVPCFKDLDKKYHKSAPHGLNENNSITYTSYEDLMRKINNISEEKYALLRRGAIEWATQHSCSEVAKKVLLDAGITLIS